MQIFSNRSFQFDDPAGEQPPVIVKNGEFAAVPDWVADSTMFKLARADEDIRVIVDRQDVKAAELGKDSDAAKLEAEKAADTLAKKEADGKKAADGKG
ncbi:hypothetical protein [Paenibacillus agricola]|uniref:Uncharacterized protein n=1 Tax=Paenibacillus agricola TaxID=2716264 RepID=A0ABX0JF66_9BACL|nr:hypothetical protein [Paenibacillus agricola]NHN33537.1 hypothetical protein [Paenibacillus agricola]